jgi:TetR/AcrR family transcriptional regulator, copper-responsive repressor
MEVELSMRPVDQKDKAEKKPRGRPRAYEPTTALRRAALAFWKNGYAGTSLENISAATGMNRPSLHAAFGDKHEIYVKALRDYLELKFAAMRKAFERSGSLVERLMRVYDTVLSIYFSGDDLQLGCFMLGTAVTEAPVDLEIQRMLAESFDTLDADFEKHFKRARADGELKHDADPKAMAMVASATMHSMAIRARAGGSRSELRKLAQKAIRVIFG